MGRICAVCSRSRPNERFGGKGLRARVCSRCRGRGKAYVQHELAMQELYGYVCNQRNISQQLNVNRLGMLMESGEKVREFGVLTWRRTARGARRTLHQHLLKTCRVPLWNPHMHIPTSLWHRECRTQRAMIGTRDVGNYCAGACDQTVSAPDVVDAPQRMIDRIGGTQPEAGGLK